MSYYCGFSSSRYLLMYLFSIYNSYDMQCKGSSQSVASYSLSTGKLVIHDGFVGIIHMYIDA